MVNNYFVNTLEVTVLFYKNDNSAFLTFGVISLCYIWQWLCIDYVSALQLNYRLEYIDGTW